MDNRARQGTRPKGRDDEIVELSVLFERVGSAVVIVGEPGIGKTSVLRRSLELAEARTLSWSGRLDDVPVWAETQSAPPGMVAPAEAGGVRGLGAALDSLASAGPFVIVIDDADRLDTDAATAVAALLRRAGRARWSIAVAARRFDRGYHDGVARFELGPLPQRVMEHRFTTRRHDTSDRSILDAAHGNLAAMNCLVSIEESFNRPDDLAFLDALIAHRLADDPFADLVAVASLAEGPLSLELAARFLGASPGAVSAALGTDRRPPLVRVETVDEVGRAVVPVHPAIGRAVVGATPAADRRRLHAVLADLFASTGSRALLVPGARHLLATEESDLVKARGGDRAARVLEREGRLDDAIALLSEVDSRLALPEARAITVASTGRLLGRLGRMADARATMRRAIDLLGPDADWTQLATIAVTWCALEFNPADAEPTLIGVLERVARTAPPTSGDLGLCVEAAWFTVELARTAFDAQDRARGMLDRVSAMQSAAARILVTRQVLAAMSSQRLLDELEETVGSVSMAPHHPLTVQAMGPCRALGVLARGSRCELETLLDEWSAAAQEAPVDPWNLELEIVRLMRAMDDADPIGVVDSLDRLMHAHGALDLPAYLTFGVQYLWRFHTGDQLPIEVPQAKVALPAPVRPLLHTGITVFEAVSGDLAARDRLQDQIAALLDEPNEVTWVMRRALVAWAAERVVDRRLAAGAARALLSRADEFVMVGHTFALGPVGYFIAHALRIEGDTAGALQAAEGALAAARRRRSRPWIARCLVLLADIADAVGGGLETHALRAEATDLADRFGLAPVLQRLRTTTARVGAGPGREDLMIQLLVAGRSNRDIASETGLSVKSVERILSQLYRRLGVANRQEAVRHLVADLAGTH